jgi:hypothetical protein
MQNPRVPFPSKSRAPGGTALSLERGSIVNSLVRCLAKPRVAVATGASLAVAAVSVAIDSHLPVLVIPVLPAGLAGGLLITLGFIVGRAYGPAETRRPDPAAQVGASAALAVTGSRPGPLADSTTTYTVLPALSDSELVDLLLAQATEVERMTKSAQQTGAALAARGRMERRRAA